MPTTTTTTLGIRASFWVAAALASSSALAQSIEDHSLPRIPVKTFHLQCPSGRLAIIRFDTRQEPLRTRNGVRNGVRS